VVSSRTQVFPQSSRYAPHLLLLIERVQELDNLLVESKHRSSPASSLLRSSQRVNLAEAEPATVLGVKV
jgi:hypothetical protein